MDQELESKLNSINSDVTVIRANPPKSRPFLYGLIWSLVLMGGMMDQKSNNRYVEQSKKQDEVLTQLQKLEQDYRQVLQNQEEILKQLRGQ